MKLTFLGSGTSHGVPMIACNCSVCTSTDARDKRLRASVWLHDEDRSIIIDVGPDFRQQVLRAGVSSLDAVLLTHTHADHLNGIDDLRVYSKLSEHHIPFYASEKDCQFIKAHFEYIFNDKDFSLNWGIPRLELIAVKETFKLLGLEITPIPLVHGKGNCTGYKIGDFAYLTDCSAIPATSLEALRGVRTVVIDGLRWTPHPTHFTIEEALAAISPLHPERVFITHICHNVSYQADSAKLPKDVYFAYDGLEIEVVATASPPSSR